MAWIQQIDEENHLNFRQKDCIFDIEMLFFIWEVWTAEMPMDMLEKRGIRNERSYKTGRGNTD